MSTRLVAEEIPIRVQLRSQSFFTLLAALVLCLFAFDLVAGEARAEERLPQTTHKGNVEHSVVLDGEAVDPAAAAAPAPVANTTSVASPAPPFASPGGLPPTTSEPEPATEQFALVVRNGEVVEPNREPSEGPQKPRAEITLTPSDGHGFGKPATIEPGFASTLGSPVPESDPRSSEREALEVPVAPDPGAAGTLLPFTLGGDVSTGSPASYPPEDVPHSEAAPGVPITRVEPIEQPARPAASFADGPVSSRSPDPAIPPSARWAAQPALTGSSAAEVAKGGAVQAFRQTFADAADAAASAFEALGSWTADYLASGEATEGILGGATPAPLEPIVPPMPPPGNSSFFSSTSGVGQAGSGGGIVVSLLGVLVLGLILARRDGPLYRVPWKHPKPTSALLMPLERPG